MIMRVIIVLSETVVDRDGCFNNLCGSHQSGQ